MAQNGGMTDPQADIKSNAAKINELNETIRYTLWSVFRASEPFHSIRQDLVSDTESFFEKHCSDGGVTVRGTYDLSGMRADADVMVWWHAESSDQLQKAYSELRRTAFGRHLTPVWSNMAVHRPAEFNRSHIPAFLADEEPRDYLCVYPFVRSYEWYLLEDRERQAMLAEHGQMAREFPGVRANTVASFALGDYEWILAFECDELHRIVDLMRHLRGSRARLHVRDEVPFYTGRRRDVAALVDDMF